MGNNDLMRQEANKELRALLDTFQRSTDQFMQRVEAIQERLNIDPEDESAARQALHPYLLYKEIMRLEDEVDAG